MEAQQGLSVFVKASLLGCLLQVAILFGLSRLPGAREANPLPSASGLIVLVLVGLVGLWLGLKVLQVSLAYFTGREFASSVVFFYGYAASLGSVVLVHVVASLLSFVLPLGVGFLLAWPLASFIAAFCFRVFAPSDPSDRPLRDYWMGHLRGGGPPPPGSSGGGFTQPPRFGG